MPPEHKPVEAEPRYGQTSIFLSITLTWVFWAGSIAFVRPELDRRFGDSLRVPATLLGLYGAALLLIYVLSNLAIWWRVRHVEGLGRLRLFGFDLRASYHRRGVAVVDLVTAVVSLLLTVVAVAWRPLWSLAPCGALGVIAGVAGLALGSSNPWPMRRRTAA